MVTAYNQATNMKVSQTNGMHYPVKILNVYHIILCRSCDNITGRHLAIIPIHNLSCPKPQNSLIFTNQVDCLPLEVKFD